MVHLDFPAARALQLHPSSESPSLLVTRADGSVELHDAIGGQFCTRIRRGYCALREPAVFSKDRKRVVCVDDAFVKVLPVPPTANPLVARGAIEARPLLNGVTEVVDMGISTVRACALSPDSIVMACAGGVPPGYVQHQFEAEKKRLSEKYNIQIHFDNCGWLQDSSGCLLALMIGQPSRICSICWSPDGSIVATAGKAMEIVLWDVRGARRIDSRGSYKDMERARKLEVACVLHPLQHSGSEIRSISFSPDGNFLLSVHDSPVVTLWDIQEAVDKAVSREVIVADRRKLEMERRERSSKKSKSKNLDTKVSGTGSDSRPLSRSSTRSGVKLVVMKDTVPQSLIACKFIDRLSHGGSSIHGHSQEVVQVAWSPDARLFCTGSKDGTVRVVQSFDKHCCAVLGDSLSRAEVIAIAVSTNAAHIVALSKDRVFRVWSIRTALAEKVEAAGPFSSIEQGDMSWVHVYSGSSGILNPDCKFEIGTSIDEMPTCLSTMMTIEGRHSFAIGDKSGRVHVVEIMDSDRQSVPQITPPIVTAAFQHKLGEQRIMPDTFLSTTCPACGLYFP